MAGGASIVVDIKAQITGYQEQIEKIRQELKKVDPGSSIGKSLMKTLTQAEQKLNQLSRSAEKRVTSQGQLDHLFDQLHQVNDLMRSLGQGMSNVGLDDVLLTASDHARQLGSELKQLKTDMTQKGASFFEDLKKTNPKELQAVFDQLKFDPSKMGIDEFVSKFDAASKEVKEKIEEITKQQQEAQKEADQALAANQLRAQLPGNLQTSGKVTQKFLSAELKSTKFVSEGQQQANVAAQNFLDQIRTGLEKDARDDKTTEKLNTIIASTADKLTKAKSESEIEQALTALDKAITANTATDVTGTKSIASLTGGLDINKWVEQLTGKAQADQEFIARVQAIADILSKNESTATTGTTISEKLNTLVNPSDIGTFESNMKELIKVMSEGLTQFNQETAKLDAEGKQKLADSLGQELNVLKGEAAQLEAVKTNPQYAEFRGQIDGILTRVQRIEQEIGLEGQKSRSGVAGGVQSFGKGLLNELPKANQEATESLKQYGSMLEDVQARQQMVGKIEGIAQRWFSVYAAVRMVSKAFRSMVENIKNLDKTITEIAIVTDMSQGDLWKQMPDYTKIARKYGASLQGVYEVSQLYYQQGLGQSDVMALTEETLKMARISGLDYSEATNYMTNAVRSFKIEMQDASRVVDVYSALAATSASSTSELATAMSKTASSAAAVGSSFEATSAMMAVMIETTRESPENIGSALKSIISRYGELKENKTGIDEEGEEYSLNKVDTALQSVGISIHDAKGEFRDFDDVIMELADSWDTIDTNTQRYIATVMAGNRQQSRFLALVSNGERLREETDIAENSEDAATLQMLKTMDSIDYKSQQLQTSLQSLYTSTGVENLFKGILDGANQIVETFTQMPTVFQQLPIPAIVSIGTNFLSVANLVMTTLRILKQKFIAQWELGENEITLKSKLFGKQRVENHKIEETEKSEITTEENAKRQKTRMSTGSRLALGAQLLGTGMNLAAGMISDKGDENRRHKAELGIAGSALQYGALGFQLTGGNPWGAGIGAIAGGLMGVWQNLSYIWESTADQAKRLKAEAEEAITEYKQKKAVSSNTEKEIANIKKLSDAQFDSVEAREKYIEAANKLATDMPGLVNYYDAEGNAILDLSNAYAILAEKRREANDASNESAQSSLAAADKIIQEKQETVDKIVTEGITKSLNLGGLTGTAKDKWQAVKDTDNIMQWAAAAEFGGGKGNDLSGIIQIANKDLLSNTPGLEQLYNLLVTDNGSGIRNLIETPEKRDSMFKQWNQELESITDPASKAAIDFVLYQLQGISTELTSAFGELNQATANRTATIHSNVAEYVNNFIADTRTMAEYGPNGEEKTQAKEMLEMFKDLNNSSEIVVNYLTQQFLANSDKYKTWDDFVKDLEDPEKSPLLNFLNVLNQVPESLYTELNDLLQRKSQYTKEAMQQKIADLLGNNDLAQAIIDTYSNYYDNLIDAKEFKKQINKQTDATYFKTTKFFENGDTFDFLPTLSGEEMSTILDMKDRIESMYSSGRITKLDARKFMNVYSDLWGTGDEAIQGIISRITDFSAESLEELYTLIDNSDEFTSDEQKETFKQSLATLFGFIPQNLNTSLKSYEEQMVTTAKDYSKDMSSATKGMDYEAASELAKKLNIDTSTEYFDVREGELFLKNTSLIYDHYFGKEGVSTLLTSKMHEYSENLNQHIESLNQLNLKDLDEETLTQEQAETYGVDLVTLKQVIKDFKQSGLDTITEEWISNYFEGTITNTEDLVNTLFKSDDLTRTIDSGKLKDIVKAGFISDASEQMVKSYIGILDSALKNGDFSRITGERFFSNEFKSKLPELKKNYDEAQSSVVDSLINSIDETFTMIEGSEFNQELLQSLSQGENPLVQLMPAVDGISNAIITATKDQILAYLEANEDGLPGMKKEDIRAKIASINKEAYEKSQNGVLQSVLSNYDKIDEVTFKNFTDYFSVDQIDQLFTQKADGTRKANLPELIKALNQEQIFEKLDDVTKEKIEEIATKAIDDGMSSITNAAGYVTKGTTKYQDMQDFVKLFNEAASETEQVTMQDLFTYDKDAQGYVLDANKYREYLENEKQLLLALGEDTTYINGLIDNANQSIMNSIDIKGFLNAENQGGKARKNLKQQISNAGLYQRRLDALSSSNEIAITQVEEQKHGTLSRQQLKDIRERARKAAEMALGNEDEWIEATITRIQEGGTEAVSILAGIAATSDTELSSSDIQQAYQAEISKIEAAAEQLDYGVGSLVNGKAIEMLNQAGYDLVMIGDNDAVITGLGNITEAYQAYYDALVASGEATLQQINEAQAKVLEVANGKADEQNAIDALGNASSMTYSAFAQIFTNAGMELTDVMMKSLTSDGIVEALGGNKMRIADFTRFAQIMGWDYNSEEYVSAFKTYNDSLISQNKAAEQSITDEVKALESSKGGEQINLTKLYTSLQEKISSSYIYDSTGRHEFTYDPLSEVQTALAQYGGTLKDGILTLADNANLIGIAQELKTAAQKAGVELEAGLEVLEDTIRSALHSYVSAIQNGIKGALSGVEKLDLTQKAASLGIKNLDFTETAEGFKLSEQSAISLYTVLKQIDAMQAQLVFDDLKTSLEETNENFKSSTSLIAYIEHMSEQINSADSKVSKARQQQYEAELEVAKEILMVRATSADDSFNFMSNSLPAAQQNPLNYAKNWTQALNAIKDAFDLSKVKKKGKTGFIDYQDWYNIVNEMNNIAALGDDIELAGVTLDGSMEAAAQLIQKGAESLTSIDSGELKVDLSKVGIDMKAGAEGMQQGVTSGIQAMAKSQVEMLDGLIAMLELIVQMEQLGDIDTDSNGIDLSDLFEVTYDKNGNKQVNYDKFSKDYENWVKDIKDKINKDSKNYNKDLANAVNGIKIDGTALVDILDWTPAQMSASANESVAKAYAAILDAFNKAALSGNYDLDNIQQSVLQVLAESGFDDTVTLDIGDITYVISAGTMTTIDWTDTDVQSVIEELSQNYDKDKDKARDELTKWIQAYGRGELHDETELHYVLRMKKKVTMEGDKVTSVTAGGKTYYANTNDKATMDAAINAAVLEDFGHTVTEQDIKAAVDGGTATVTVKTKIGNVDVDVESNNGQVLLVGPHGKYKNQAEFLEKEWEYVARDHGWIDQGGENARHYDSKEEWQWGEYRIPTKITPKFTYEVDGGDPQDTDPSKNSILRKKLTDLIAGGRQAMQEVIDAAKPKGDGTYTVDLGNGFKFTFTGGEDPLTAFEQAIGEQLGIDTKLSNTISTAIANAFANEQVSNAVSKAISEGIKTAFGAAKNGETTEIPIPSIMLKPNKINIDTSTLNTGENTSNIDIPIQELTAIITAYQNGGDPDILVSALNAIITNYTDTGTANDLVSTLAAIITSFGTTADPNILANALSAIVTSYTNGGDPNSVVNALTALVNVYMNTGDPDALVNNLTALVKTYENEGTPDALVNSLNAIVTAFGTTGDPNALVNALSAIINTYLNGGDPNAIVNDLTAKIGQYENGEGVIPPELDNLTQTVDKIETSAADAALQAWRVGQENNKITISAEINTDPNANSITNARTALYGNIRTMTHSGEHWLDSMSLDRSQALEQYGLHHDYGQGWNITEGSDLSNYIESLRTMVTTGQQLGEVDFSNLEALKSLNFDKNTAQDLENLYNAATVNAADAETNISNVKELLESGIDISSLDSAAQALERMATAVASLADAPWSNIADGINSLNSPSDENGQTSLNGLLSAMTEVANQVATAGSKATGAATNIGALADAISRIPANITHNITLSITASSAKGNVSIVNGSKYNLAWAKGNARAGGQSTLMGELGPELVVSNGQYFVVGQNGAEFVDLDPDAIVFNHKQTASLLSNGKAGRGKPLTNEDNAISWAKGNVNGGPAMASASAALAALRQLRAQWAALAGMSAQDLAGLGGGGGGGGGGDKGFIRDLERWYDWLQKIAQLEKEINYEEAKRRRLTAAAHFGASGRDYYDSQRRSLSALLDEMQTYGNLQRSQQSYFDRRRSELNNSPFSRFYTFDENGQMHYQNGAFEQLAQLAQRNQYGEPGLSAQEQYERLIALNPEFKRWMQYTSSGEKIKDNDYAAMLQAFWDKVNSDKDEMQNLHDSIEDAKQKMQELAEQQYQILQEMKNNQMDLEQKIYDTIVDIRQRAIDELSDTKDAIEQSNDKFIKGLTDALSSERQMYEDAKSQRDLDKLRNKRDILIRSGGSASEIASLNEQIEDSEQSMYFDKQQEEIDAIQAASDKQIERLDQEIQLLTEVLEYQKKYGLLWAEVTEIMMKSPQEIANFIAQNNSEYWNKSPVATAEAMNDLRFGGEQWASYRDSGMAQDIQAIANALAGNDSSSNDNSNNNNNGGGSGGGGSGGTPASNPPTDDKDKKWKYDENYHWKKKDKSDKAPHHFGLPDSNNKRTCTVCGYKINYIGPAATGPKWYVKGRKTAGAEISTYGTYQTKTKAIEAKKEAENKGWVEVEITNNTNLSNQHGGADTRGFSSGGMNDIPGMAMLHGTKDRPEAIFNADQTRILRNNILGNRPESLVNLLKSYNDAYRGLSQNTYDSISSTSNTNTSIGRAEVNLNIDKLANDYDSRQAARTVMDEMLRIASKTSANNSVRR